MRRPGPPGPTGAGPSPVTVEVVRHAIYAIAEEMSVIIMRSARSPLLKEAGDLSSALTDARGRLIAQGRDIPIHLGVMAFTVKEFLRRVPRRELRDGDVWYLNLPEVGGNHLPDVKAIRPVFAAGRLVAFAINLAHWADVGGAVPGSYVPWADEAYQEGLRIAPIKVFDRRGPTRAFDLLMANVRGGEEREGDCRAMYSAVEVGARRLGELFARYGVAMTLACFDRLQAESERAMRAAIAAIPDGVYAGEDWVDDDGHDDRPVPVRVTVTLRGARARFDFAGTGAAVKGPINTTRFVAASAVYYSLKALVAPDVPANDGCYRPITVEVPPGTILNPPPGAPVVGGNHETSQRAVDACFKALAGAIPDRITAGGPTTSGLLLFGARQDGRWRILYEVHGGGEGGGAGRDGGHAVRVHMSNVMNTPAEVIETEYPIEILEQALRPGSGGAGTHAGGCGFVRGYRVLAETTLTTMLERRVVPPWGAFGGRDGAPYRITLERDGGRRDVKGKETVRLRAGDVILIETCGGGGYGDPAGRPPGLLARDRREGYVIDAPAGGDPATGPAR
ncbi:MAG TPA: hydantoinase B/oxoprolinase family protein [Methylomirabilota bacterium]|nr:hydantoinase B/oxoprolinase family protein [Methylomirabilota bacterium]